jgi:hypothetical protein
MITVCRCQDDGRIIKLGSYRTEQAANFVAFNDAAAQGKKTKYSFSQPVEVMPNFDSIEEIDALYNEQRR